LRLAPIEFLDSDRASEQLVDEPHAVGVQYVALAVASDFPDLTGQDHLLDPATIDALGLAGEPL